MSTAWMPLFIGDYERKTADLGSTEFGIYTRLIMWAWDHQGMIPLEVRKLCNITRCEPRLWWRFGAPIVARFFDAVDASTAQQKRVVTELRRSAEISNKRKAAALQMHSKCSANAEQMQSQSQSHKKERKREKAKKLSLSKESLPADFQPDRDIARQNGWSEERIDAEVDRFRNHALAKDCKYKNWNAAWRNWVTSPYQQNGARNATNRQLQDDRLSVSKAAKRLAERPDFEFAPRPSLVSATSPLDRKLLPKG